MDPNKALPKLTQAAQMIIYDAGRGKDMIDMMKTKAGTTNAVHSIMAALDQKFKLTQAVATLLAPIVLMLLVDFGKTVTGKQPPAKAIKALLQDLMTDASTTYTETPAKEEAAPEAEPAPAPAAPTGMIGAAA